MLTGTFGPYMEMGNPFGTPPPTPAMKRRLDWNEIRRRHPERMASHLESLNLVHKEGAKAREQRLRALLGVMPAGPMASWQIRDELAQAWEDVYGDSLGSREAWLEVRFGIRRGVFVLRPDGKYDIMSQHGQKNHDSRQEPTGDMGRLPSLGDTPAEGQP